MKSILDNSFRYKPSAETDLRATFARVRREQRAADLARVKALCATATPVEVPAPEPEPEPVAAEPVKPRLVAKVKVA